MEGTGIAITKQDTNGAKLVQGKLKRMSAVLGQAQGLILLGSLGDSEAKVIKPMSLIKFVFSTAILFCEDPPEPPVGGRGFHKSCYAQPCWMGILYALEL
eukprot:577556-Amphidinium_carterae.1